jgi:type IV secretory pathway VirB10-like protein
MYDEDIIKQANPYAKNPKYKRVAIVCAVFSLIAISSIVLSNANSKNAVEEEKEKSISTNNIKPPEIQHEPTTKGIIPAAQEQVASQTQVTPTQTTYNQKEIPNNDWQKAPKQLTEHQLAELSAIKSDSAIAVKKGVITKNGQQIQALGNMENLSQLPDMQGLQNMLQNAGATQDANLQNRKEQFAQNKKSNFYLDSQIEKARSKLEIKAGSFIPAMMTHSINSDLPGDVSAIVTQNVYDSVTGQYLLIPQGTKLNGVYDSQVAFGQKRIMTIWTRLVFPNGSTFDLGSMIGGNQSGQSGFNDKVNNHYMRTFGSAALVAIIGSGMQLSQPKSKTNAGNDAQETITANLAQQTGNTAQGVLNKMLNVQPTLEIDAGYRFNIRVNKDMVVDG